MSIFVKNLEVVRESQPLDFGMPVGLESFDKLDAVCRDLYERGVLQVLDTPQIRDTMRELRYQSVEQADFVDLADELLLPLAEAATETDDPVKAAISIRAGNAFYPFLKQHGVLQYGYMFQSRAHTEEADVTSLADKLGLYVGMRALAVDPMLATGGSMEAMARAAIKRGARRVTVVAAFSTPQGIYRASQVKGVDRIITLPIEAGLTRRKYVVGGIGQYAMLGDFGDRYFGEEIREEQA